MWFYNRVTRPKDADGLMSPFSMLITSCAWWLLIYTMAVHFCVFSKQYTNQMIPLQFKFKKKKDWLKIKYFFIFKFKREKTKIFSFIFYRPFNFSYVCLFIIIFRPPWPQISNRADFPDVTSQLHKLGLVASHKINKIYLAAALFMCEFVRVHAPGLLNNISVIIMLFVAFTKWVFYVLSPELAGLCGCSKNVPFVRLA